jgi:hypothetical protein
MVGNGVAHHAAAATAAAAVCLCVFPCLLHVQIEAMRAVAEPYTASAFKVGRRISTAASDAFDRMSTAGPKTRTKSHFGKQRVE